MFCGTSPRHKNISPQTGNVGLTPTKGLSFILRVHPRTRQMDSDLNGQTNNSLNFLYSKQVEHVNSATQIHCKYKWPSVSTEAKEF